MTTLVIGLPGTGKTTWVKERLGDGLCYDLDAIAAALRLTAPHKEYHSGSRLLADLICRDFIDEAQNYANDLFIIRSAPGETMLDAIGPDLVICCRREYRREDCSKRRREAILRGIEEVRAWCDRNRVPFKYADEEAEA